MKTNWIIITALAMAASGPAWAVRVEGAAAPAADTARRAETPNNKAAQADDSSSMREGVIAGVSAKRDQVEINGSWLNAVDGVTHVFRRGQVVGRAALAKGQKVRFTLAPGAAGRTTLGAVYVP